MPRTSLISLQGVTVKDKQVISRFMNVDEFDFDLPEDRIALRPARPRSASRLLSVAGDKTLTDRKMTDLPDMLKPGDLLVFNDTKVIPARLKGRRISPDGREARIEVTLHLRKSPNCWLAFARPAKKLSPGDKLILGGEGEVCLEGTLDAWVEAKGEGGEVTLAFDFTGPTLDHAIAVHGELPLPPYIAGKRPVDAQDIMDYQTIFAARDGAVAAPTAALHFDHALLEVLQQNKINTARVTLHVGAGTFLPVKVENTVDHKMHAEWGEVSAETSSKINQTRAAGGRIVAVGTTSLRLLESAAKPDGMLGPWAGETDIFITPGYHFRAVDILLTNFHLPRSTLFMLVAAFSGLEVMQAAYAHAIAQAYRFYSYGDACLLFPADD